MRPTLTREKRIEPPSLQRSTPDLHNDGNAHRRDLGTPVALAFENRPFARSRNADADGLDKLRQRESGNR